jgi:hypothetical protein
VEVEWGVRYSLFVEGMVFEVEIKKGNPSWSVAEEEGTVLGLNQDPMERGCMRLN